MFLLNFGRNLFMLDFWLSLWRWLIFRLFKGAILVYLIREKTDNRENHARYYK